MIGNVAEFFRNKLADGSGIVDRGRSRQLNPGIVRLNHRAIEYLSVDILDQPLKVKLQPGCEQLSERRIVIPFENQSELNSITNHSVGSA